MVGMFMQRPASSADSLSQLRALTSPGLAPTAMSVPMTGFNPAALSGGSASLYDMAQPAAWSPQSAMGQMMPQQQQSPDLMNGLLSDPKALMGMIMQLLQPLLMQLMQSMMQEFPQLGNLAGSMGASGSPMDPSATSMDPSASSSYGASPSYGSGTSTSTGNYGGSYNNWPQSSANQGNWTAPSANRSTSSSGNNRSGGSNNHYESPSISSPSGPTEIPRAQPRAAGITATNPSVPIPAAGDLNQRVLAGAKAVYGHSSRRPETENGVKGCAYMVNQALGKAGITLGDHLGKNDNPNLVRSIEKDIARGAGVEIPAGQEKPGDIVTAHGRISWQNHVGIVMDTKDKSGRFSHLSNSSAKGTMTSTARLDSIYGKDQVSTKYYRLKPEAAKM